jgi:anti-sigma factor RsiW
MTDRFPDPHAQHDPLLVAALAAGDLATADRELAESLTSRCTDCALLEADLRAITAASAALPGRTRPRDFTLRAEDAARLRRRGWRGVVRAFAGPGAGALRPLATGLTTLGIAGLLVAAMPAFPLGGSAGTPALSAAASPDVPKVLDAAGGPEATSSPDRDNQYSGASQAPDRPITGRGGSLQRDRLDGSQGSNAGNPTSSGQPGVVAPSAPGSRTASPLVILSGTFLILGLGLFGLRWTARRLGDG